MQDIWTNMIRSMRSGWDRITAVGADYSLLADYVKPFIIVMVITIFSFLLVDIFYNVLSLKMVYGSKDGNIVPAAAVESVMQGRSVEQYKIITERNLFSTTLQPVANENAVGEFLPSEEYTAFDLKGTVAINESIGYVIVEEKGKGKQKLYKLGEMIGQAKLIRITRNTAVLEDGGKEFVMKVKEADKGALTGGPAVMGSEPVGISRQESAQALGDMKSVMSQAIVRPFLSAGVPQGFIVSNIVPGSVYQRLGIQNGDVIVDVNNKKLENTDDIINLFNAMQAGGSVSVNLVRGGKKETVNYTFQ
ncbi:MAG TPA: PDZ domain-containing protein [Smithellaceae bacterium]|nr:PDZ domain-containing protein [Smithellaceae bacterium]